MDSKWNYVHMKYKRICIPPKKLVYSKNSTYPSLKPATLVSKIIQLFTLVLLLRNYRYGSVTTQRSTLLMLADYLSASTNRAIFKYLISVSRQVFLFQNNPDFRIFFSKRKTHSITKLHKTNLHIYDTCNFEGSYSQIYMVMSNATEAYLTYISGPSCSKLTTSLVNDSLKFQKLISQICQYFLLKKSEKVLQCKSFSYFVNKKYQCFWL